MPLMSFLEVVLFRENFRQMSAEMANICNFKVTDVFFLLSFFVNMGKSLKEMIHEKKGVGH